MLRIDIVKQSDGSGVLRCTRADGSVTWQKQSGRHAAFFALHDLTHYAVETVLGYRRGFFGLVAEGWEMEDTTGKGNRGTLPPEAVEVEHLVGLFDAQRGSGSVWTADEFNAFSHRPLTEQQLHAILARRAELFRQWGGVAAGQALTLMFD
ncbi:MAG: hypothetical protein JNL62_07815 [Bryobacterales bacterium]|nr:hypothetical protein [Bryobacterales bacterium]